MDMSLGGRQPSWEQGLACFPRGTGEISASCTSVAFHLLLSGQLGWLNRGRRERKNVPASRDTK